MLSQLPPHLFCLEFRNSKASKPITGATTGEGRNSDQVDVDHEVCDEGSNEGGSEGGSGAPEVRTRERK